MKKYLPSEILRRISRPKCPMASMGPRVTQGLKHAQFCRQISAIPLTIIDLGNITCNSLMIDNDI